MTLTQHKDKGEMWTSNATVIAYRSRFMIPKAFANLEEMERVYKSWRGIREIHSHRMEKPNG